MGNQALGQQAVIKDGLHMSNAYSCRVLKLPCCVCLNKSRKLEGLGNFFIISFLNKGGFGAFIILVLLLFFILLLFIIYIFFKRIGKVLSEAH